MEACKEPKNPPRISEKSPDLKFFRKQIWQIWLFKIACFYFPHRCYTFFFFGHIGQIFLLPHHVRCLFLEVFLSYNNNYNVVSQVCCPGFLFLLKWRTEKQRHYSEAKWNFYLYTLRGRSGPKSRQTKASIQQASLG